MVFGELHQISVGHEFEDEVDGTVFQNAFVALDDVRMGQAAEGLDFGQAHHGGDSHAFFFEHFDGDLEGRKARCIVSFMPGHKIWELHGGCASGYAPCHL